MLNALHGRAGAAIAAISVRFFILISFTAPIPALGQGPPQVCQPRNLMLTWLQENYREEPNGIGVANGRLIELLTSPDGASWTIIQTAPKGISCLIVGGEGWRTLLRAPDGPAV